MSLVEFNVPGCTISAVEIIAQQLVIKIDYNQSIDNVSAELKIKFDP
jgi:hypothetical protein